MGENGIEWTIENLFDEGNKGKNNESDSDSDKYEEKEKKVFRKLGNLKKNIFWENVKIIMNLTILIMIMILIIIKIREI